MAVSKKRISPFGFIKVCFKAFLLPMKYYEELSVHGNDDFIKHTIDALELLKESDRKAITRLMKYFSSIYLVKKPLSINTYMGRNIAHIIVGQTFPLNNKVFYASVLAQMGYYQHTYVEAKKDSPRLKTLPKTLWNPLEAQKKSLEYRYKVLKNLEAPYELMELTNEEIEEISQDIVGKPI